MVGKWGGKTEVLSKVKTQRTLRTGTGSQKTG